MRTINEAASRINKAIVDRVHDGMSGFVTNLDFVLCEDFETVMIYVDTSDEDDAVAVSFDLEEGQAFDLGTFRHELQLKPCIH